MRRAFYYPEDTLLTDQERTDIALVQQSVARIEQQLECLPALAESIARMDERLIAGEKRFAAVDEKFKCVDSCAETLSSRVWGLIVSSLVLLGGIVLNYFKGG